MKGSTIWRRVSVQSSEADVATRNREAAVVLGVESIREECLNRSENL